MYLILLIIALFWTVGVIGIASLSLSLRFAVGSLMHKLKSRQKSDTPSKAELLMTKQPPAYKKVSVGELTIHTHKMQCSITCVVLIKHMIYIVSVRKLVSRV